MAVNLLHDPTCGVEGVRLALLFIENVNFIENYTSSLLCYYYYYYFTLSFPRSRAAPLPILTRI